MQDIVRKVSQNKWYSTLDLKSAYHQIALQPEDKKYTAFEADGRLFQFTRVPFGLKNAVPCFQRIINDLIEQNDCKETWAYLDNVTVAGKTKEEHDINLQKFLDVAKTHNITLNDSKCFYSTDTIDLLGYRISRGTLRPDPERVKPLLEMPVPENAKALKRALGMFAYYAQWIPAFSDKIRPLVIVSKFPVNAEVVDAFQQLKQELSNVTLEAIDDDLPFTLETDASEVAISATLNQNHRPVAFYSRTLNKSEMQHSSVEKEATAIVDAVRHWSHFLHGRRFKLVTDQKSVAFMYDSRKRSKTKNAKIMRWRMDLAEYDYEIIYRAGKYNFAPDALSRTYCANLSSDSLNDIHASLCHPGITRLYHFVKTKNLPYSIDEVRRVVNNCRVCAEVKPKFFKPQKVPLIKATQAFERLNIDFKGPLPSVTKDHYILTITDEFSRFPFAFACPNIASKTVISCLNQLFTIFGLPAYIHSDQGKSFMSIDLVRYLNDRGVATSNTSIYNPRGNGQCERYNAIIWSAVKSALKSQGLPIARWQQVLPDALHATRSLLCTSTNVTPHERMFSFQRRSALGPSFPTWLSQPGPVLLRRHVRSSKNDPLIDEVELIHATPSYAKVRFPTGREATVSLRDIAPTAQSFEQQNQTTSNAETVNFEETDENNVVDISDRPTNIPDESSEHFHELDTDDDEQNNNAFDKESEQVELRRSTRQRRQPDRLMYS